MSQHAIWGATIRKAVVLQWVLVLALAGGAWVLLGPKAGKSLFCGGAVVALPNTVLALWMLARMSLAAGMTDAMAIMRAEALKLGLTVAALVMVASKLRAELSFPALLSGMLVALIAQWLALWVTRRY